MTSADGPIVAGPSWEAEDILIDQETERMSSATTAGAEARSRADDSVRAAFTRLYADGRAYASAELDKQKAKAGIVTTAVRTVAICAVIALILVFAAIVTLLVGLVFALAPIVGAIWSTLIVVGIALVIAVLLLMVAKSAISAMKKALTP